MPRALGRGDAPRACATWGALTASDPFDFTAWFGLGNCLRRDEAVVPDRASPSGWRFRTSYHRAALAYQRALQLRPAIHRSLVAGSYESVRSLLKTSSSALRRGRSQTTDSTLFAARPSWQGDTLAYVPYPLDVFARQPATGATNVAVRHQREQFHAIAQDVSKSAVAGLG